MCEIVQLLANVGLLATRWRLRTKSDVGNTGKRYPHKNGGPWATLSRARRASSPIHISPSRTTTATHCTHASQADRATTEGSSNPTSYTPTNVGSTYTRNRTAAGMHVSHALNRNESNPSTRDRSRSALNAPRNPDGSSSISSISSAAPPKSLAASTHLTHHGSRTRMATAASVDGTASDRVGASSPFSNSALHQHDEAPVGTFFDSAPEPS